LGPSQQGSDPRHDFPVTVRADDLVDTGLKVFHTLLVSTGLAGRLKRHDRDAIL
jgi:hypothetical protein